MKRVIKLILKIALAALIVIQFVRPELNEDGYESVVAFEMETKPTPEVAAILKTNCYDCHSDQTEYPWYSKISPINYWLEDHIKHGKGDLNVSKWEEYSVKRKEHKLEEVIEMVEDNEMPLDSYTWIHGSLSDEDKNALIQWATLARLQYQKALQVSASQE